MEFGRASRDPTHPGSFNSFKQTTRNSVDTKCTEEGKDCDYTIEVCASTGLNW